MKYLIAGGDERMVCAAAVLAAAGNEVLSLGMEKASLPDSVRKAYEAEGADCVILPLPAESSRGGAINAPFSRGNISISGLLDKLPENTLVCGGKISGGLKYEARIRGLPIVDYMTRPELVTGNAAITAEAALCLLMQRTDFSLFGRSALVIGYGRIGRILSDKLRALGVKTYVMSRNADSRALAEALGCIALAPADTLPPLDMVINTAPAPVLTTLEALCSPCLLLELASAPGGLDSAEAFRLGHRYFAAPGLPGKYAPKTAGALIAETVMKIVKEHENE
ncbi:MAG: dipicolinate synthase subunit DpsA [Bacillota bacterium]|nr:dipicolinate synthase subunit DpsA [Bacillota bacterium]